MLIGPMQTFAQRAMNPSMTKSIPRAAGAFPSPDVRGEQSPTGVPQAPPERALVRLSEVLSGRPVMVRTVSVAEARLARHLEALGIMPGRFLVVERCAPFGGAVMVRVGDARYALGRAVCDQILVEALAE